MTSVAAKAALASKDWVEKKDPSSGKPYYVQTSTKKTVWDLDAELSGKKSDASKGNPPQSSASDSAKPGGGGFLGERKSFKTDKDKKSDDAKTDGGDDDLEDGWVAKPDVKSGKTYYFHKESKETTWTKPVKKSSGDKRGSVTDTTKAGSRSGSTAAAGTATGSSSATVPAWKKELEQRKKDSQKEKEKDKEKTGASPSGASAFSSVQEALDAGAWTEMKDKNTGRTYYVEKATKKTTWNLAKELGLDGSKKKSQDTAASGSTKSKSVDDDSSDTVAETRGKKEKKDKSSVDGQFDPGNEDATFGLVSADAAVPSTAPKASDELTSGRWRVATNNLTGQKFYISNVSGAVTGDLQLHLDVLHACGTVDGAPDAEPVKGGVDQGYEPTFAVGGQPKQQLSSSSPSKSNTPNANRSHEGQPYYEVLATRAGITPVDPTNPRSIIPSSNQRGGQGLGGFERSNDSKGAAHRTLEDVHLDELIDALAKGVPVGALPTKADIAAAVTAQHSADRFQTQSDNLARRLTEKDLVIEEKDKVIKEMEERLGFLKREQARLVAAVANGGAPQQLSGDQARHDPDHGAAARALFTTTSDRNPAQVASAAPPAATLDRRHKVNDEQISAPFDPNNHSHHTSGHGSQTRGAGGDVSNGLLSPNSPLLPQRSGASTGGATAGRDALPPYLDPTFGTVRQIPEDAPAAHLTALFGAHRTLTKTKDPSMQTVPTAAAATVAITNQPHRPSASSFGQGTHGPGPRRDQPQTPAMHASTSLGNVSTSMSRALGSSRAMNVDPMQGLLTRSNHAERAAVIGGVPSSSSANTGQLSSAPAASRSFGSGPSSFAHAGGIGSGEGDPNRSQLGEVKKLSGQNKGFAPAGALDSFITGPTSAGNNNALAGGNGDHSSPTRHPDVGGGVGGGAVSVGGAGPSAGDAWRHLLASQQ